LLLPFIKKKSQKVGRKSLVSQLRLPPARYNLSPSVCAWYLSVATDISSQPEKLVKLKSRKSRIWRLNRLQHRQGESTTDF